MREAQEELPDLPQGWAYAKIGEICSLVNGRAFKAEDWSSSGLPIIRIQNLNNHDAEFNYCSFDVEDKYYVDDGQLLFAWSGTPGTSFGAHIWNRGKGILNQHIFKVNINEQNLNKKFLMNIINYNVDLFIKRAHGTAGLAHITKGKFEDSFIPLPPFNEQHRIVARIEELFSRLDAGVEALRRAKAQLQRYRQSVLQAGVEGRLTAEWRAAHPEVEGAEELLRPISEDISKEYAKNALFELPDSWTWTSLGNLIAEGPQNGLYLPQSSYGSGVPILRIDDFQDDCSRSSNQLRLVNACAEDIEKYSLRDGDLVINRVNSPSHLGKCLLVSARNLPAIFESNMMRLQLSQSVDPQFIVIYLRSLFGKRQITINAKWAVNQASINQKDVSNTFVPFPPFPEQMAISEQVESALSLSNRIDKSIDDDLIRTSRLRQSILQRAFQGKLVPQDPGDEPASLLLERIRAERIKESPRRGRRSNTHQERPAR